MKVLIINDLLIHGGAEMQGLREKSILEEKGYEVYFLTFDYNFPKDSEMYSEKNRFYNIKVKNKGFEKVRNKFYFNKCLFKKIDKVINNINPDIIHVNNLYLAPTTQYKVLKKWKCIQTIRDYSAVCPLDTCIKPSGEICLGSRYNKCYKECGLNIKKVFKIFRSNIYNNIRKKYIYNYICPSEKLTEYCIKHGYNIQCINNPFDFKKFIYFSKEIDFENKKYLYYGNINKDKGVLELIRAFNKFSESKNNVELLIAGKIDGEIEQEFLSLCKNEKINYLGYLKYDQMINTLKKVYGIIVPSVWMENYPNTVLEGLATKTLVLGSNRGGIPAMLDNNRGIIFDIANINDIIEKLESSYKITENDYRIMVENSYNYTYKNNNIEKYYNDLIRAFNHVKVT